MANTLGKINPFRYCGYVYDEETKLYYLRSRYYNASQQRFMNADVLLSGNLYMYCANIPVSSADGDGYVMACCLDDNGMICTFTRMVMDGCCGGAYAIGNASRGGNTKSTRNENTNEQHAEKVFDSAVQGAIVLTDPHMLIVAL